MLGVLTGWEDEDGVPVNGVGTGRNRVRKWDVLLDFEERWEVDWSMIHKESPQTQSTPPSLTSAPQTERE